jgi:hypothetical protein
MRARCSNFISLKKPTWRELSDTQLAEHVLAVNGVAVVSAEVADEIGRIEALNYNVSSARLNAVLFSLYSGVLFSEYRKPLEFA